MTTALRSAASSRCGPDPGRRRCSRCSPCGPTAAGMSSVVRSLSLPEAAARLHMARFGKQAQPPSRGPRQPRRDRLRRRVPPRPVAPVRASGHRRAEDWETLLDSIISGSVSTDLGKFILAAQDWWPSWPSSAAPASPTSTVSRAGRGGRWGRGGRAAGQDLPAIEATWQLDIPSYLKPGPELGRIWKERTLFNWPEELLGIHWHPDPGDRTTAVLPCRPRPPRSVASRRAPRSRAPGVEVLDRLGCRVDRSALLLARLSGRGEPGSELPQRGGLESPTCPRTTAGRARGTPPPGDHRATATGRDPARGKADGLRGDVAGRRRSPARRTAAQAARIEQITMELGIKGAPGPAWRSTMGDADPAPGPAERDRAVLDSERIDAEGRRSRGRGPESGRWRAVAYLRHRFSARSGEADPRPPPLRSRSSCARSIPRLPRSPDPRSDRASAEAGEEDGQAFGESRGPGAAPAAGRCTTGSGSSVRPV